MKLIIDEAEIKKSKLSFPEVLYLILVYRNVNIDELKKSLQEEGLISSSSKGLKLTEKSRRRLLSVNKILASNINYENLAKKLQNIYPEGRKEGTTCMWRDSVAMIAGKLKTLVIKYNCSFTEEQAINVVKEYVNSFNGDYTYMQVLKYFLLKSITFPDGDREVTSEFMSRLENYGQDNITTKDWSSNLI